MRMQYLKMPFLPKLLEKTENSVLRYLLENTGSNRYEISKGANISYSSVHKAVENLLEKGLIEIVETKHGKRNPNLKVEYYQPTKKGALQLLAPLRLKVENILLQEAIGEGEKNELLGWIPQDMVCTIVDRYPKLFPRGFKKLSRNFRCVLAVTPRNPYTYISIIQAKLRAEPVESKFKVEVSNVMTVKDLRVLSKITEKMLAEEIQERKQQKKTLEKLMNTLQQVGK